jgi:twinkle protein|tara:strand:+ start:3520 stop:5163 length:1644 start_codon:yes stop_codon:yes gene_type:complete
METENNGFIKYHLPCPLCSSSDAVSMNKDGSAYCFSCQEYIKEYNMETQQVNTTNSANEYEVKDYLKQSNFAEIIDRNIREQTCKRFGVTVKMDSVGTITNHYYPYHDKQGAKIATKTRYTKLKEFSIQGNTKFSGLFGEHLFSKNKYIIITEGELDCLSAYQIFKTEKYETPVVSIKNGITSAVKDIKTSLDFLEQFDNVIINFDNDKQGQEGAMKVAELFSPGKCKVMHLPEGYKDASDCLSKNKLQLYTKAFWDAKLYAPDGIINANILFDEITKPTLKSFVQYPFEGMNKITYGLRPSELVTFTAGSGLGKTQVMREIVHHIIKSTKDNIGLLMLEETPVITSKGLMSIEANQRLHLPDVHVSKEEMKTYFDATVGTGRVFMFDHFGSNSIDNIVSRVRYLAKGLDCKYVIIDHVSIIVSDQSHGDERRALDEIMTRLRTLVQETGLSMIVVSHLRRPEGKGHEEGASTSLSQLRGSASIGQLSDMVIGLERDAQNSDPDIRNTTRIRVLKNRFSGLTGPCCDLKYDVDTGRLNEVQMVDDEI